MQSMWVHAKDNHFAVPVRCATLSAAKLLGVENSIVAAAELARQIIAMSLFRRRAQVPSNHVARRIEGGSPRSANDRASFRVDTALIQLQQVCSQKPVGSRKHSLGERNRCVFPS